MLPNLSYEQTDAVRKMEPRSMTMQRRLKTAYDMLHALYGDHRPVYILKRFKLVCFDCTNTTLKRDTNLKCSSLFERSTSNQGLTPKVTIFVEEQPGNISKPTVAWRHIIEGPKRPDATNNRRRSPYRGRHLFVAS